MVRGLPVDRPRQPGWLTRDPVTKGVRVALIGASRLLNFHKRHPPVGAPPGTLVFPAERRAASVRVTRSSSPRV